MRASTCELNRAAVESDKQIYQNFVLEIIYFVVYRHEPYSKLLYLDS